MKTMPRVLHIAVSSSLEISPSMIEDVSQSLVPALPTYVFPLSNIATDTLSVIMKYEFCEITVIGSCCSGTTGFGTSAGSCSCSSNNNNNNNNNTINSLNRRQSFLSSTVGVMTQAGLGSVYSRILSLKVRDDSKCEQFQEFFIDLALFWGTTPNNNNNNNNYHVNVHSLRLTGVGIEIQSVMHSTQRTVSGLGTHNNTSSNIGTSVSYANGMEKTLTRTNVFEQQSTRFACEVNEEIERPMSSAAAVTTTTTTTTTTVVKVQRSKRVSHHHQQQQQHHNILSQNQSTDNRYDEARSASVKSNYRYPNRLLLAPNQSQTPQQTQHQHIVSKMDVNGPIGVTQIVGYVKPTTFENVDSFTGLISPSQNSENIQLPRIIDLVKMKRRGIQQLFFNEIENGKIITTGNATSTNHANSQQTHHSSLSPRREIYVTEGMNARYPITISRNEEYTRDCGKSLDILAEAKAAERGISAHQIGSGSTQNPLFFKKEVVMPQFSRQKHQPSHKLRVNLDTTQKQSQIELKTVSSPSEGRATTKRLPLNRTRKISMNNVNASVSVTSSRNVSASEKENQPSRQQKQQMLLQQQQQTSQNMNGTHTSNLNSINNATITYATEASDKKRRSKLNAFSRHSLSKPAAAVAAAAGSSSSSTTSSTSAASVQLNSGLSAYNIDSMVTLQSPRYPQSSMASICTNSSVSNEEESRFKNKCFLDFTSNYFNPQMVGLPTTQRQTYTQSTRNPKQQNNNNIQQQQQQQLGVLQQVHVPSNQQQLSINSPKNSNSSSNTSTMTTTTKAGKSSNSSQGNCSTTGSRQVSFPNNGRKRSVGGISMNGALRGVMVHAQNAAIYSSAGNSPLSHTQPCGKLIGSGVTIASRENNNSAINSVVSPRRVAHKGAGGHIISSPRYVTPLLPKHSVEVIEKNIVLEQIQQQQEQQQQQQQQIQHQQLLLQQQAELKQQTPQKKTEHNRTALKNSFEKEGIVLDQKDMYFQFSEIIAQQSSAVMTPKRTIDVDSVANDCRLSDAPVKNVQGKFVKSKIGMGVSQSCSAEDAPATTAAAAAVTVTAGKGMNSLCASVNVNANVNRFGQFGSDSLVVNGISGFMMIADSAVMTGVATTAAAAVATRSATAAAAAAEQLPKKRLADFTGLHELQECESVSERIGSSEVESSQSGNSSIQRSGKHSYDMSEGIGSSYFEKVDRLAQRVHVENSYSTEGRAVVESGLVESRDISESELVREIQSQQSIPLQTVRDVIERDTQQILGKNNKIKEMLLLSKV